MSAFYLTNISESEYIEIFKKQREKAKIDGEFPEIDDYINSNEIGINGVEKFLDMEEELYGCDNFEENIIDNFMDNEEFIATYFDGDYTIDDYFNDNIVFTYEYKRLYLFLDLEYLEYYLNNCEEELLNESISDDSKLEIAKERRIIKMLIRYKKNYGLNVAFKWE